MARGYWNNEAATEATFRARTTDGDGPFLRTGDLAFVHEGEIYLCGRLKDVIIIRGQNHHPQDLEWGVGGAHPALRPNCAAAFGVPDPQGEQLVLVTEVNEALVVDPEVVFGAVRAALSEQGLAAKSLVLMPTRGLPKTSSGKIQRSLARELFLAGTLPTLHRWDAPEAPAGPEPDPIVGQLLAARGRRRLTLLVDHLQTVAAGLLGVDRRDVDTDRPFGELGLDSVTAVEMVERIGRGLGLDLPGTVLFDYPTIEGLCRYLIDHRLELDAPGTRPAQSTLPPELVDQMSDEEIEAALLAELED